MKRKFTLLELLIVTAILAILISLLLPALNGARERGMGIKCIGNLKHFGFAFSEYSDLSNGIFVFANTESTKLWNSSRMWGPYYRLVSGQTGQPDDVSAVPLSRLCPNVPSYKNVFSYDQPGREAYHGWTRPSFYGLCGGNEATVNQTILQNGSWFYHNSTRVHSPSAKVLQAESSNDSGTSVNSGIWSLRLTHADPEAAFHIAYAHTGKANVLYFDLHIAAQGSQILHQAYSLTKNFEPYTK